MKRNTFPKTVNTHTVTQFLSTIKSEPKGSKIISYTSDVNQHTISIYGKVLNKLGLCVAEVGEGDNGQYIIVYRITDKGRALLPKLEEVDNILNVRL